MSRILNQLRPNERVLWEGKPVLKAFVFASGYFAASLFGLFFLIVVLLFFLLPMLATGIPPFFVILPFLLFLIIPVLFIIGPPIWSFLAYKNTYYLISDQRLITQTGAIGVDTRFVDLDKVQEVYVSIGIFDKLFGTGNIFASTAGSVFIGFQRGQWGTSGIGRPHLAALKDPYDVQRLLEEAIRNIKQTNNPI